MAFEPGTLWRSVPERTEHAVRCGALQRISTRTELVPQHGVPFVVRVVDSLERKRIAGLMQQRDDVNPFLPYDEDLFVADVSDTHVCLLNRFNVVEHHLLIVTRQFEDQETLLTVRDFEAMWICMREFEAMAFYNAGRVGGASQPHKHLQQVSLPLGSGPERMPMDPLLAQARYDGTLGTVQQLPFVHVLTDAKGLSTLAPHQAAEPTWAMYLEMLEAVGQGGEPGSYNLLVTRDWMLLVPRSAEAYDSISVNALGFAGSLLVRDERELNLVCERGPMAVLREVGVGR